MAKHPVIIGDLNAKVGPHDIGTKNICGDALLNFSVLNTLVLTNTIVKHRMSQTLPGLHLIEPPGR